MANIELRTRSFDAGCGAHQVISVDGIIRHQSLSKVQGSGYYTGNGNPEFVGQSVSILRGKGFKKVRAPKSAIGSAEFEIDLWNAVREAEGLEATR